MSGRVLGLLILSAAVTTACTGEMPTSPSTMSTAPTTNVGPTTAGAFDGHWVGVTEQAKPVEFTVADNRITEVTYTVAFPPESCGGNLTAGAGGSLGLVSTTSAQFVAMYSSVSGIEWVFEGTFSTASSGRGTVTVIYSRPSPVLPPCNVRASMAWTANRAP